MSLLSIPTLLKIGNLMSKGLMGRDTSTCLGLAGCDELHRDGLARLREGLHGAEMDQAWLNGLDLRGAAQRSLSSVEMSSSESRSRHGDLGTSSSSVVCVTVSAGLRGGGQGLDGTLSPRGSAVPT